MEFNKTEALRECRRLLRSINCEAVTDTNDVNLYDMLFHSEEKKKILLSWLIQRLFLPETCMKNSFEDLLSMFITKQELKSFMKGTMPIPEQYKRWKLTMNTLHQLNQSKKQEFSGEVNKSVLDGTLLDFYEDSWNEKVSKKSKNYGLLNKANFKMSELQMQLQRADDQLKDLNLNLDQQVPDVLNEMKDNDEADTILENFKRADKILIEELNDYLQSRASSSENVSNDYVFSRSSLDEHLVRDIKKNIIALHQNNNTLRQLLQGMKSFEPLKS